MTEHEFMAWYYNSYVPELLLGYKTAILDDGGTWDDLKATCEYTLVMLRTVLAGNAMLNEPKDTP
jgi:hypothetical protein